MKQIMQMKKLLVVSILLAILTITLCSVTAIAFAQPLNYDDFDIVFLETAKELHDISADEITLTANKELLLDIQLQPLGFVYDFTINEENGYAVVINIDNVITVTEFALGDISPYPGIKDADKYYSNANHIRAFAQTLKLIKN